ncbi:MAG TPA: hypothetical protein VKO16_04265 [Polyangia bacterium]|nr:hypothetical protein [Polyangia bacterium]
MSRGAPPWMGIALGIGMVTCGGGGAPHVEISGKSPADGAALAASAVCMHEVRCGEVSITCEGGGGGGSDGGTSTTTCTATIGPVVYADCYANASSDIETLLSCPALTADQVNTLDVCFDTLDAQACVTQAEADAQAHAAAEGTSPPSDALPVSCALLSTPPPGCSAPTR